MKKKGICKTCGKVTCDETITCCRSCANKIKSRSRGRRALKKGVCETCGKVTCDITVKYCKSCCQFLRERKRGNIHPLYKNGSGKVIPGIAKWSKKVRTRDNYTCQICGITSNELDLYNIHAHHIKDRKFYPELMFDVDNGVTLCRECHLKAHGGKFNCVVKPTSI